MRISENKEKPGNKMSGRILLTFAYGISFTLPVHLLWFYHAPVWFPLRTFLNGLYPTIAFLIPAFLPSRIAKPWLVLLYAVGIGPSVISGMHLLLFEATISPHSLYAIFATSFAESKEFIASQIGVEPVLLLIVFAGIPLFPLCKLLRAPLAFGKSEKICVGILCAATLTLPLFFKPSKLVEHNLPYSLLDSYITYQEQIRDLREYMKVADKITIPGIRDTLSDAPRTIVIVIGESSNRHHWELYGYRRPTTPKLNAIREELFVFTDVISPHGATIPSVRAAMSLPMEDGLPLAQSRDNKSASLVRRIPLMNLFNQAGFETYWISNQNTVDCTNALVQLASGASKQIYLNRGGYQGYSRQYDEAALPALKRFLDEKSTGKRVFFLHLMGSHVNYASRYPSEFNVFTDEGEIIPKPWHTKRSAKYINNYDNSILYTDFVLSGIIDLLRTAPNSALLYFSDHGEEVYDTRSQHGHVDNLNSRHYVDIPFLIWLSRDYAALRGHESEKWRTRVKRPFINSGAPYVIADLAGVSFDSPRRAESVLSEHHKPGPRIVAGEDYDARYGSGRDTAKSSDMNKRESQDGEPANKTDNRR